MGLCRACGVLWNQECDRCYRYFPCLSDPVRRSSLGLKVALIALHLVYAGFIFLLDRGLLEKCRRHTFFCISTSHMTLYSVLFLATLIQYFYTAGSSPGYVEDAMRAFSESEVHQNTVKKPASSKAGNVVLTIEGDQFGRNIHGNSLTPWAMIVMSMYPPGSSVRTWTCTYCSLIQPPRAKHCHDCDKCVLQFDHHCVWLGTCIGQSNHCRFWWYIFEETTLCLWTGFLYIQYIRAILSKSWWIGVIAISLLLTLSIFIIFLTLLLIFHSYLILTNQTTYELVRRRRIPYLRGIPERVYPFSGGIRGNVYDVCCRERGYQLQPLPPAYEIEAKSRPCTCLDLLLCRCC